MQINTMQINVGRKLLQDLGKQLGVQDLKFSTLKDLFSTYSDNGDGENALTKDEKIVLKKTNDIYKLTPLQQIKGYPLTLTEKQGRILLNNIDIFDLLQGYTIPAKYLKYCEEDTNIRLFKDIVFKKIKQKKEHDFFVTKPTNKLKKYCIYYVSHLDNINTLQSLEFFIIILHELGHYIDWKIGESQAGNYESYSTRESTKYINRQIFMPSIDRLRLEETNEEVVHTSLKERNAHNIALSLLKYLYKNKTIGHTLQQYYPKEIVIPFMKKALITYALATVKKYVTYEEQKKDNDSKVDFEKYFDPINEGIAKNKGSVRRKLFI